jgi:C-terminal processing protease CtpA/Prc
MSLSAHLFPLIKRDHTFEEALLLSRNIIEADFVGDPCNETYGGIGVTYGAGGEILSMLPNAPAKRNGLQVGDVLFDPVGIRGAPGTKVSVHFSRNGYAWTYDMVREEICCEQ